MLRRPLVVIALLSLILVSTPPPVRATPVTNANTDTALVSVSAALAASITSDALEEAKHILRSAYETTITQADVFRHLEAMMRSEGADGGLSFPTLVMSGPELMEPHGDHLDDERHVINPATEPVVMIDIGCKHSGHCSDVTRTFFFETATQEMKDAYNAVLAAEEAVIAAIAPGVEISVLDAIMRNHLSEYYGRDNVTVLTYWGHGVGRWVHEMPILYNTEGQLELGTVLAIEPGLYFEDGWAVRVEDTVEVTETGVEILSDAPKALEDVMINQTQPHVAADIQFVDYEYGRTTSATIVVSDSAGRNITGVDLFNGYSWSSMERETSSQFALEFALDYSFSSQITYVARVQLTNDTYYFTETKSALVYPTGIQMFDPTLDVSSANLPPESLFTWIFAQAGAQMIRLRFKVLTAGWDQFLIKDSQSRVFAEYRNVHDVRVWTPWIADDELHIQVVDTEPPFLGGVAPFSFSIDMIEYAEEFILPPVKGDTTTTEPTSSTPPATEETTPSPSPSPTPTPSNSYHVLEILTTMSGVALAVIVLGLVVFRKKGF